MKKIIIFFVLICLSIPSLQSQVAIGVEAEGSLYQWYKKPRSHPKGESSSGQLISLIAVGPKIWFGDWDNWTISIEGKVDLSNLSFDVDDYGGIGAISFPTLIKGNFSPFGTATNGETKIGIGIGAQWTKSELYAKPDYLKDTKNPFYLTYIGELSMQIVVADGKYSDDGHSLEFFIRSGWGKEGARSFNLGMKYNYRMNFY